MFVKKDVNVNLTVNPNDISEAQGSVETPLITVASGDGIGPEIMDAALKVLEAGGARFQAEPIEIGEKVYLSGISAGITPEAWDSLRRTRVFFKAPITTPQGGGYKSLNVTVRKSLGLFANVRPCAAYAPYIATKHPDMDVVIVRENEEDLYAGIEHRQTDEVYQCLKLISRPGCEKIVRYAFEYARAYGRKKVTCMVKDNIMKLTDGLFAKVFDEIAAEYSDIEAEHYIIDIGTARLADAPERFDVIVTPNLYGDIISDVAAEVAGSVGLGASANIGASCAMFEAIHGSAPDIAGQNIANPSGLILAGVMMLVHLGQSEAASRIHNAWLKTVEDGFGTGDMKPKEKPLGTKEFAQAVIERMGQHPATLPKANYAADAKPITIQQPERKTPAVKEMVGVDLFVQHAGSADALAEALKAASNEAFELVLITNRGVKVWPEGLPETFCTDHWRCRFHATGKAGIADVADLLAKCGTAGIDAIKTENLYTFDGERGYSLGQGQ